LPQSTIELRDASTLQPVHQWLAGAEASVARTSDSTTSPFRAGALSFSADSRRIAWTYSGGGYAAEVADVNTKKIVAHIPLPDAGVALEFSPDGTQLAIGNKDTTIGLWDLSKTAVVRADGDTKPE
ncbi:MAG: WD40 repeat domain-containing protein, partial [Fuerstia sp.]|nr:WD40 repeat domain-containing protein [Fuerstiella sp.]